MYGLTLLGIGFDTVAAQPTQPERILFFLPFGLMLL
jgi:hypothetical protein